VSECAFVALTDCRRTEMHWYGGASSKPNTSYDVEMVAAPGDSADSYCKGHGTTSGEYTYAHVWQPASLSSVDVPLYQHANRMIPTELAASSAAAVGQPVRHCCRDHLYESPTFDENCLETAGHSALVFPPYYFHAAAAAAAAARQSRPSEACSESRRVVVQQQLSEMTSDEHQHQHLHHHHHQQQQQQGGQVGVSDEKSSVSGAAAVHDTLAVSVGEWYQPCRTTTTRYEPVMCRTSSSDPDVTPRPRTENHYT